MEVEVATPTIHRRQNVTADNMLVVLCLEFIALVGTLFLAYTLPAQLSEIGVRVLADRNN